MLVITRKKGEDIDVETPRGEKIIIRVVRIRGAQVRIGILAKRDVTADRHMGEKRTLQDDIKFKESMK